MAKMRRTKKRRRSKFLGRFFFRMEEISCENEQEDSAKNPYEEGIDERKGSLEGTKSLLNNMMLMKFIFEVEKYEIGDMKTEIFYVLLTLLIDFV